MTSEAINSLHILVDFDNDEKSLEVDQRAGTFFISLTVDTGSPTLFLNKRSAEKLLADKAANASMKPADPELQSKYIDYNRNAIEIHGVLFATIHSNGWTAEKCRFLVVEKKCCLLGLDLHNRVGIVTKQLRGPGL